MAKKTIPFSAESEEAVLGSVLLDSKGMFLVNDMLSPSSFHLRENQIIWEAIDYLYNEKKPIDILTVRTYLDDRNLMEQAGGNAKLIALTDGVFSAHNVEQYAKTVRSKHIRRQIIQA